MCLKSFTCSGLLILLLSGCDEGSLGKSQAVGTTTDITACIKDNLESAGVSRSTLEIACKYQFEKPIFENGVLSGEATFDVTWDSIWGEYHTEEFIGEVQNTSSNYVITHFAIRVSHENNPDKSETKTFDNVWIEPNSKFEFTFLPKFVPEIGTLSDALTSHGEFRKWVEKSRQGGSLDHQIVEELGTLEEGELQLTTDREKIGKMVERARKEGISDATILRVLVEPRRKNANHTAPDNKQDEKFKNNTEGDEESSWHWEVLEIRGVKVIL